MHTNKRPIPRANGGGSYRPFHAGKVYSSGCTIYEEIFLRCIDACSRAGVSIDDLPAAVEETADDLYARLFAKEDEE